MKHQGFISKVISEHLVLVDTDKQSWRIVASEEIARLGGHRCNLQNAGVTFEFDGTRVTDFRVDLPSHDGEPENSTISFTNHMDTPIGYGFMQRECGCHLAFHIDAVVTYGRILVGVDCRHRVKRVDGRAVATEVELYQQ